MQQAYNADHLVFVHEQVELCSEIPVEKRVHRVADQQSCHQHCLHAPPRCVEHVQRCQTNNATVTATNHLQRSRYQHFHLSDCPLLRRAIATDVTRRVVSACVSVTWAQMRAVQKWLNQSRCSLGVGLWNFVLDWGRNRPGKGYYWGDVSKIFPYAAYQHSHWSATDVGIFPTTSCTGRDDLLPNYLESCLRFPKAFSHFNLLRLDRQHIELSPMNINEVAASGLATSIMVAL